MVLISIDPFALRKIFLVIAALLCFSVFCFADPVFMAQHYLPATGDTGPASVSALERDSHFGPSSGMTGRAESMPLRALDFPARDHRALPKFQGSDGLFGGDPWT